MESQEYLANGGSSPPVPASNSLASSVLQNVFRRTDRSELPTVVISVAEGENLSEPSLSASEFARSIISRLDERKERASVELGIAVNEVGSLPFDLSKLESEGIFMNIDCRGFGSLVRQLEWKTLGVRLPEDAAVRVSPPRTGLLPDIYRNKLMRGAAQAHNALNRYGFRFTLCETVWGTSEYKWIPWTAFESFEQAYLHACETLAKAKAEVLEKYDEILAVLQDSFYTLAEDSADRFRATTDEPFDRAEFVNAVAAQAIGMVPTPEMIRDGLTIEMRPNVIILGSEMIAERNLTQSLRLETERVEAERTAIELDLDSKRRIEQMKVASHADETRREREVKERIRNMKIEVARREAEEAVSPVKEGFAQLTAKLFEAATEMAEKLKGSQFVSGSLAKRARQMCEWYSLMNFTGDDSLEGILSKLGNAAGREAKLRSPEEMKTVLNDLLRMTTVQSKKLLDEDRLSALEL
jgi:hypothetical protein